MKSTEFTCCNFLDDKEIIGYSKKERNTVEVAISFKLLLKAYSKLAHRVGFVFALQDKLEESGCVYKQI